MMPARQVGPVGDEEDCSFLVNQLFSKLCSFKVILLRQTPNTRMLWVFWQPGVLRPLPAPTFWHPVGRWFVVYEQKLIIFLLSRVALRRCDVSRVGWLDYTFSLFFHLFQHAGIRVRAHWSAVRSCMLYSVWRNLHSALMSQFLSYFLISLMNRHRRTRTDVWRWRQDSGC